MGKMIYRYTHREDGKAVFSIDYCHNGASGFICDLVFYRVTKRNPMFGNKSNFIKAFTFIKYMLRKEGVTRVYVIPENETLEKAYIKYGGLTKLPNPVLFEEL